MASTFHFLAKGNMTQTWRCEPNGAEWRVHGCHQSLHFSGRVNPFSINKMKARLQISSII